MRRRKGLNDEDKSIIKESAKGTSLHIIAENLVHHVDMVGIILREPSSWNKQSDCVTSKTVTARDLRSNISKLRAKPRQTIKAIFTAAGLSHILITTKNRIIWDLYKLESICRWAWVVFLFTAEIRATPNWYDSWSNSWVYFRDELYQRLRCRQQLEE